MIDVIISFRKWLDKVSNLKFWPLMATALTLLLMSGCASNYYTTAVRLQQRNNYLGAIENYDEFIARSSNGAMITKALNNRSKAYHNLGIQALESNHYRLAARFFYLANTLASDEKMVDAHYTLANIAYSRGEMEQSLAIINFIIDTYPHLPVIPEIIFRRIELNHQYEQDKEKIWKDYVRLADRYNEDDLVRQAIPIIDSYMPEYILDAKRVSDKEGFDTAIKNLLYLNRYPHSYQDIVTNEIGLLYFEMAEGAQEEESYFDAERYYRFAVEYDPQLRQVVDERLNQMVSAMISFGDSLLTKRKVDEAKDLYQLTYAIIPNNQAAREAISRAEVLQENIEAAEGLFRQAEENEKEGNIVEALRLYRLSYQRDRLQQTADKIFLMTNLIEIEKNPVAFARTIIEEYKNGLILRNLQETASRLRALHGDDVRVSGWRIMLSTGANRYELRYDVTSPSESNYYIWQVNLLNRALTPLNKDSQEIMED
jgi:hypothetical protein